MRLYKNIFKANTLVRYLKSALVSHFILKGATIKGTLLGRIVGAGVGPLDLIIDNSPSAVPVCDTIGEEDGLVECFCFSMMTTTSH